MKNPTVILQLDRDDLFALFDQFLKERVQATKSAEQWPSLIARLHTARRIAK